MRILPMLPPPSMTPELGGSLCRLLEGLYRQLFVSLVFREGVSFALRGLRLEAIQPRTELNRCKSRFIIHLTCSRKRIDCLLRIILS